jgi:hypothetical protein
MKLVLLVAMAVVLGMGSAFCAINEKKVENAKRTAAKSGKLIAFVFYQGYYAPNCPKCIAEVNANNATAKKVVPRQDAVVIEVVGKEAEVAESLPSVVSKDGPTPRVVVTDADCGQIVAEINPGMSKADLAAFEKKVKDASSSKR